MPGDVRCARGFLTPASDVRAARLSDVRSLWSDPVRIARTRRGRVEFAALVEAPPLA
jgi:hypothetical protein